MLTIPKDYKPVLNYQKTQSAIKIIRDTFQNIIEKDLKLTRVSAPRFVKKNSGLNDNLNGFEKPVTFEIRSMPETEIEIVHSLAKWKRLALKKYGFTPGQGLYTNMDAIRKDEDLDNLHSVYVDQWDWERVIVNEQRNFETLKREVIEIFNAIKKLENNVREKFNNAIYKLPEQIYFLSTEELLQSYPNLNSKQRENKICKEKGCVFLSQIGKKLSNGQAHDNRAPDYDDWELNGDILFWYEPLDCALEISSMGIRVNTDNLQTQLKKANKEERMTFPYHQSILKNELPLSIGGGIGQSRLCMLLLKKAHIGEVQASIWPESMLKICQKNNIHIL